MQRLVAVPAFGLAGYLQPDVDLAAFSVLFGVMLVAEGLQARILLGSRPTRVPLLPLLVADIAAMALAVMLSGGARSEVMFLVPVTLIVPSLVLEARTMLAFCGLTVLAVGVPVLVDTDNDGQARRLLVWLIVMALVSACAAVAARVRARDTAAFHQLAEVRQGLLAEITGVEQRERHRLAQTLHDGALQGLLAATQDLEESAAGDPDALGYAQTSVRESVDALTGTIAELHPASLSGERLPGALTALARQVARRLGVREEIDIDPEASGEHDELLLAVARDLVVSGEQDAVRVRLHRRVEHLALTLGGSWGAAELVAADERLQAVGGKLVAVDGGVCLEVPAQGAPG